MLDTQPPMRYQEGVGPRTTVVVKSPSHNWELLSCSAETFCYALAACARIFVVHICVKVGVDVSAETEYDPAHPMGGLGTQSTA